MRKPPGGRPTEDNRGAESEFGDPDHSADGPDGSDGPDPIVAPTIFSLRGYRPLAFAVAAGGVAVRLWYTLALGFLEEDALITLRYARNLWIGEGLVYNPGARVMGFTSPLWTIVLAPVGGPFGFRTAQVIIGIFSLALFAASVPLAFRIMRRYGFHPISQLFVLAVLAFHVPLIAESVSGMEMSLYLLLILGSANFALDDAKYAAFGLAALTVLTRPEGTLWWGTLFLFFLLTNRRALIRSALLPSAVLILPWLVFAQIYYGSFIPLSASSKSFWAAGDTSFLAALLRPSDFFLIIQWMSGAAIWSVPYALQIVAVSGWLAVWGCGIGVAIRRRHDVLLLFASFSTITVFFYYFGRGLVFPWYSFVPNVLFLLVAAEALNPLLEKLDIRARNRFRRIGVASAGTVFAVVLIGGMLLRVGPWTKVRDYEENVLRAAGEYVERCSRPDARFMLEPIGYTGFFSKREILDLAGLVSPEFKPSPKKFEPGWNGTVVREFEPDYFAARQYEVPENISFAAFNAPFFGSDSDRAWFEENYSEAIRFGDRDGLIIYRHRSAESACP